MRKRIPYTPKVKIDTESGDFTSPDIDNDKTGIDNDADKTVKQILPGKSKLDPETDPTEKDTEADKTKKENFPVKPDKK